MLPLIKRYYNLMKSSRVTDGWKTVLEPVALTSHLFDEDDTRSQEGYVESSPFLLSDVLNWTV